MPYKRILLYTWTNKASVASIYPWVSVIFRTSAIIAGLMEGGGNYVDSNARASNERELRKVATWPVVSAHPREKTAQASVPPRPIARRSVPATAMTTVLPASCLMLRAAPARLRTRCRHTRQARRIRSVFLWLGLAAG